MDDVWERVAGLLDERRLSQAWLARALELPEDSGAQTINNWKRRGVPSRQYAAIAAALHITVDELLGLSNVTQTGASRKLPAEVSHKDQLSFAGRPRAPMRVPVVGTAKMGNDGYYYELETPTGHGDGFIEAFSADSNAYALRVKGDSMHPAIKHGQVVLVEPNGNCMPGENVLLALKDGRRMVKELVTAREDSITVLSVNGGHRETFERGEVLFVHSIAGVFSSSKWRPE